MTITSAARQLIRRRDAALAILARLDDGTCKELARRARGAPVDGFPSGGSGVAVSTSDVSRPTERAAFRGLPTEGPDDWSQHLQADPVGDAIAEVFAVMAQVEKQLLTLDRKRGYVLATASDKRGRISSIGSCQACTRSVACNVTDRLRAGFCAGCWSAWVRAGRPDRVAFIRDRPKFAEMKMAQ